MNWGNPLWETYMELRQNDNKIIIGKGKKEIMIYLFELLFMRKFATVARELL